MVMMVAAATVSGCVLESRTNLCKRLDLRCQPGQECAADQAICIPIGGCGNHRMDKDEVCDDGNIMDGDGCSANCTSNETCGNGVQELNESCDFGDRVDGDGCSSECQLETKVCGNGVTEIEIEESCDGFAMDTPGCDRDCTFPECGDGLLNMEAMEQCDSEGMITEKCNGPICTMPVCGDNFYNPAAGEECDTGEGDTPACNGTDSSPNNCQIPRCGDQYTNEQFILPGTEDQPEECDTGGVDKMTCDFDCTEPVCGDGHPNMAAGETCDDGDNERDDDCPSGPSGSCQPARCGDGFRNTQGTVTEQCDTGGVDTAECDAGDCTLSACGDGYLNSAADEVCDPGNTDHPSVGCTATQTCVSTGTNRCKACI